ncbi:MAG: GNAT family N-acetyltransferase [Candidatus Pacebacteria bacterium]|nr:GNAT family N-acetyltransferase [Candidatus Paceibacterota bacterium]
MKERQPQKLSPENRFDGPSSNTKRYEKQEDREAAELLEKTRQEREQEEQENLEFVRSHARADIAGRVFDVHEALQGLWKYADEDSLSKSHLLTALGAEARIGGRTRAFLRDVTNELRKTEPESVKLDALQSIIFAHLFRSLPGNNAFEGGGDNSNTGIERCDPNRLSDKDRETLRAMYRNNYADRQEFAKTFLEQFDVFLETISEDRDRLYLIRDRDAIIGFARFTDSATQDETELMTYMSAVNIDPAYKRNSIGRTMLDALIHFEAQNHRIEADCVAHSSIAQFYIESGFAADRFFEFQGVPSFHITYMPHLASKDYHHMQANIAEDALEGIPLTVTSATGDYDEVVPIYHEKRREDLPLNLINEGLLLTRYFSQNELYFAVFEPRQQEENMNHHTA